MSAAVAQIVAIELRTVRTVIPVIITGALVSIGAHTVSVAAAQLITVEDTAIHVLPMLVARAGIRIDACAFAVAVVEYVAVESGTVGRVGPSGKTLADILGNANASTGARNHPRAVEGIALYRARRTRMQDSHPNGQHR